PEPSLAERWEVSPDLRVFTFHLRHDARWSNGRSLTSADVVYSLARTLHPPTASRNASDLFTIVHGQAYNAGRARMLLRDAGGFRAGEAVAVTDAKLPSSNLRRTTA